MRSFQRLRMLWYIRLGVDKWYPWCWFEILYLLIFKLIFSLSRWRLVICLRCTLLLLNKIICDSRAAFLFLFLLLVQYGYYALSHGVRNWIICILRFYLINRLRGHCLVIGFIHGSVQKLKPKCPCSHTTCCPGPNFNNIVPLHMLHYKCI